MTEPSTWPLLRDVRAQFRTWHLEGKYLPTYKYNHGDAHLVTILGWGWDQDFDEHEPFLKALLSPNGWAIYQVKLAQRGYKDDDYTQRKAG